MIRHEIAYHGAINICTISLKLVACAFVWLLEKSDCQDKGRVSVTKSSLLPPSVPMEIKKLGNLIELIRLPCELNLNENSRIL